MIEVQGITKVYGKGKKATVALNGVSFTLPDAGFVFVVGKSGCGKSTLLNMIGGCDKLTAGEIIVDGNKFSTARERDFDNFRCGYVGFIFQDYCLLDGLTVFDNVALALDLKGEEGRERVEDALCRVCLSEYADRYPGELSGGQQQRVAIARTLVKNPRLILADEPTGNLDSVSTRIILDTLSEISKSTLVLIVSHNRADAEQYADRIIELSEGRVVADCSRNPSARDISVDEGGVVIQKGAVFSEAQIEEINAGLVASKAHIRQVDDKFLPTAESCENRIQVANFPSHKLRGKGFSRLLGMFLKKRRVGMIVTTLSIALMVVVMGVCQLFTQFSPDAEIARLYGDDSASDTLVMQKGAYTDDFSTTLDISRMVRVTEADIKGFRDSGYTGGIYPLYNVSLMTNTTVNPTWNIEAYSLPYDAANYKQFFCGSGLGVLVTDMGYLESVYGNENGKIELLSGSLETTGDSVLVTDYFADSLLAFNRNLRAEGSDPYAKLCGPVHMSRYRIAGVFKTGYRERYRTLFDAVQAGGSPADFDADDFMAFIDEADSTLNIGYSFNPDFGEAYCTDSGLNRTVYYGTLEVKWGDHVASSRRFCTRTNSIKDGQVYIRRDFAAKLFGVDEDALSIEDIRGEKITLSRYEHVRQNEPCDFTAEFTIAGLLEVSGGNGDFAFSPADFEMFRKVGTIPYSLYFDDLSSVTKLYETAESLHYTVRSPLVLAMYTVARAALVFTDMFRIIIALMFALTVITLIAFGIGSVKKGMYDIAIIRALGGKTKDLAAMFIIEMLIVSVAVCLISVFGLALGAGACNSILVEGFVLLVNNIYMRQLHVIVFRWGTLLADAAIVLLLTVIAAAVPFFIMRKVKPRDIIRAKE